MAGAKLKWREYLIELLVVIIGISIAFSIENYAANRKEKGEELLHLKGIVDDLETDARVFEEFAGYTENTLKYTRRFNELIRENNRTHDSLNFLLLRTGWISNYEPRDISYNSLKTSGGLDKLSNFELRRKIVYHYEHKVNDVFFQNELHKRNLDTYITPLLLKYSDFTSRQRLEADFFDVRENSNIFSSLEGQLSNKVDNYRQAAKFTKEILELVKAELSNF
ncbi:MAG: hypothetical protein HEP71_01240 [Roseivirga sp.]|nr:hypothetical protein [Roseivirga sp.]